VKQLAVRSVNAVNRLMSGSAILRRIVSWQHRHLPVPVSAYAWFFASPVRNILFGWYCNHVFHAGFDRRESNAAYWASRESLYWYLGAARHQVKRGSVDALFEIPPVAAVLRDSGISVLDVGCGVMKEEAYMVRHKGFLPRLLTGIDMNEHIGRYVLRDPRFETRFVLGDVTGLDIAEIAPDVIFMFGGVIEFLSYEHAKKLFADAVANGTRLIVILGEGTYNAGDDAAGGDHETASFVHNHDVGRMLEELGAPQRDIHVRMGSNGALDYFAAEF
jgi:hypothetical protein